MFVHLSRKLLGLLVVLAVFVAAQLFIPTKIEASSNTLNFQSKIVFKSSGLNITAGSSVPSCIAGGADTCDFQMRFYTVSSAGTAIYTETFSNVEIGDTNGIFNLVLNSVCSATASGIYQWGATSVGGCSIPTGVDFSQDLYYEFSFDPDGDGDFAEGENFPSSGTRPALRKAPSAYYAQVAGSVTPDSLDYDDFEDTMDLDAALTLNQGTNTWTQNFTGTTTSGLTLNTNSLTSGTGLTVSSSATAFTGNLQTISLTGNNVANTGDVLELSITGTSSAARGLYISNLGTGDSFRVDDSSSDLTPFVIDASGNLTVGGTGTFTTSIDSATTTFNIANTTATTLNIGGDATTLNLAGGGGSTGCTINVQGDIACSSYVTAGGGQLITAVATGYLFNSAVTTLHIGGATTTLNLAGGSGSTGCTIDSSGNLSCTGTIAASISANSLDYDDFEDTMDLDAALTLNQGTNTWTQNFTGTTTVGQTYNVNSLTTGTGFAISSTATGLTSGNLASITLSGSNAANAGDLLELSVSGTLSAARALYVNNLGTGDSFRVDDVGSDTTPFVIDASGNISVGGNIATTATSIDLLNATATTINFGGAATTFNIGPGSTTATSINIGGGSGATGCTVTGASGDFACSGDLTATGGDLITTATTAALFNTGATTAVNIAGAAATTNLGGTTVNIAGGSGSTGCTVDSSGNFACTGDGTFTGGDLVTTASTATLFNTGATTSLSLGGAAATTNIGGTTVNLAGGSGSTGCTVDSSGNFACTGTISASTSIAADSLDFIDFEDTLDLDNNLTLNQTTFTWGQTFTGTTTVGQTYTANSLTSGTAFAIASTATAFTGNLQTIALTGNSTFNTGDLLELSISGTTTASRALYISNLGTGDSLRILDDPSDGTPFVIDQHGNVTTGGHIDTWLSTIGLLGTPTSITFGGAATTLNIGPGSTTATSILLAGGSGATGCTLTGANGDFVCSGDITATGGDLITTATTAALFNTGATTAVNIAGAAATTNIGGTTVNLAGGSGSTGCTIDSSGNLACTGSIPASVSADSLDFVDFQDTLDLDAGLTMQQSTNTWSQIYTGTTGLGLTYTANSLTSGVAMSLLSSGLTSGNMLGVSTTSGLFTGDLISVQANANTANNTGDLMHLGIGGASSLVRGIFIENQGGGNSLVINDVASDTTPFTIDASGNVSVGGNINTTATSVDLLNTTASTINFGGAATTINLAGGNGATGCTITGSTGELACTSTASLGALTTGGLANLGAGSTDYTPTTSNWNTNGSTLLLNALNYSVIAFHDSGSRVDFIRTGAGVITLGYDGGYGNAVVSVPGRLTVGSVDSGDTVSAYKTYPGAQAFVASFFHDGNNANADGIVIQGGQDDGLSTTIYLQARDGDGTNVGRIANVAGTFALADQSDRRTKTNIVDTSIQGLSTLNALRVVDYNRIQAPNGPIIHGFIAQEVQEVYPFAVFDEDDQGMLSLSKELMIPMIVKATQELNTKVDNEYLTLSANDAITSSNLNGLTVKVTSMESKLNNVFASLDTQKLRIDSFESRITELESQIGLIQGYVLPSTASFEEMVISGKIAIEGLLTLSNKNIGISKIAVGESEVAITFETPFPQKPIVIATPIDSYASFKVNEITETGFKILVAEPVEEELVFNWFVSSTPE